MAYVKDQWTPAVRQAGGTTVKVRTAKWWRGKRSLAGWMDPEGRVRSKALGGVPGSTIRLYTRTCCGRRPLSLKPAPAATLSIYISL